MGTIISSSKTESVLVDVEASYIQACSRAPEWKLTAEERLGSIVAAIRFNRAEFEEATRFLAASRADVEVASSGLGCALVLARVTYQTVLRGDARDPTMATVFDFNMKEFRSFPPAKAVDEASKLAQRIVATRHDRVPPSVREEIARPVIAAVDRMAQLVPGFTAAMARADNARAERMRLARLAYLALTNLKKTWRGQGLSEARIHEVIPDRPRPRKRVGPPNGKPVIVPVGDSASAPTTGPVAVATSVSDTHVA